MRKLLLPVSMLVLTVVAATNFGCGTSSTTPPQPPQPSGIILLSPTSTASNPMWVGHGGSVLVKVSEAYYLGAFSVSGGSAGCFSVAMQDATTVVVTSTPVTIYGCAGSFTSGDSLGHSRTGYVEVRAIFGP